MENEYILRQNLWDKLYKEFDNYTDLLEKQDSNYAIEKSYETAIKSEIVDLFDPDVSEFNIEQIKYLNNRENVLDELYNIWINSDGDISQLIYESTSYEISHRQEKLVSERNIDIER